MNDTPAIEPVGAIIPRVAQGIIDAMARRNGSEEEAKDPKTIAQKAVPLAEHRRPTKEEESKGRLSTFTGKRDARIARDHPEILEEMKVGKYPSETAIERSTDAYNRD